MEQENNLICECHLVNMEELKAFLVELKRCKNEPGQKVAAVDLTEVDDFKKYRIIGHGCGQCLKTWEYELQNLLAQN